MELITQDQWLKRLDVYYKSVRPPVSIVSEYAHEGERSFWETYVVGLLYKVDTSSLTGFVFCDLFILELESLVYLSPMALLGLVFRPEPALQSLPDQVVRLCGVDWSLVGSASRTLFLDLIRFVLSQPNLFDASELEWSEDRRRLRVLFRALEQEIKTA